MDSENGLGQRNFGSDSGGFISDHQQGHSEFQVSHWIVTKGNWTPYGRYKQCLREIAKRGNGLESLDIQKEELLLDLSELSQRSGPRVETERRKRRLALSECEQSISDTQREYDQFCEIAKSLKAEVGDLTRERRNELDEETWRVRLRAKCATELLCSHRLSEGTVEMILACPSEFRKRLLGEIDEAVGKLRQNIKPPLIEWVEGIGGENH